MGRIVVTLDQALRILQDEGFVFHQAVRRQAALGLTDAHAAAAGRETHADFRGRLDAVVQSHAVGKDVQVIAAGGATALQQFGHRDLCRDPHHLGGQAGPYRVQAAQPGEQFRVLHCRYGPRQRLEHVVVGIDQARCHQMPARVDDFVGALCKLCGRTDGRDQIAPDQDGRIAQFAGLARVGMVESGDTSGVADQQGFHGDSFDRKNLRVMPCLGTIGP